LKELFRVHCPDSKLTDDSNDGQCEQNLGRFQRHNKQGRLEPGQTCNKSIKTQMSMRHFKPAKSTGGGEIVPVLLKQSSED
jgi:hypothetical protein